MDISIVVVKTDVQSKIVYDNSNLPLWPDATYKAPSKKIQKETITKYKLRNVVSCSINEDANNLTQTANFTLPIKNTVLKKNETINGVFTKGYLLFKNDYRIYEGQQVLIDMGYDGKLQTRFIGYITNFKEVNSTIVIELEDSMYKLKRTIQMKKNFPQNMITKYNDETGNTDKEEPFNLYHLNQWITQTLYNHQKADDLTTFVPKIRCFSTEIGKLVMKDAITPAEVLQYFYKDVFNMKAFFRLEWVESKRDKNNFDYLMQPILYVGWDNWNLQEYVEFNVVNDEVFFDTYNFIDKNISEHKVKYSNIYKFMYPYEYNNTNQYNPIVENKIEWKNTDKDNLKITAVSFDLITNNKRVVVYQDGVIYKEDAITKAESAEKLKRKKDKQAELTNNTTTIKDTNNLQVYNEITLNYPNLSLTALEEKVTEYLVKFPDNGLSGSFTVLGEPYIRQGDIVDLKIDNNHIDTAPSNYFVGEYYVKSVYTTFDSSSGIKQKITIGNKVN